MRSQVKLLSREIRILQRTGFTMDLFSLMDFLLNTGQKGTAICFLSSSVQGQGNGFDKKSLYLPCYLCKYVFILIIYVYKIKQNNFNILFIRENLENVLSNLCFNIDGQEHKSILDIHIGMYCFVLGISISKIMAIRQLLKRSKKYQKTLKGC